MKTEILPFQNLNSESIHMQLHNRVEKYKHMQNIKKNHLYTRLLWDSLLFKSNICFCVRNVLHHHNNIFKSV